MWKYSNCVIMTICLVPLLAFGQSEKTPAVATTQPIAECVQPDYGKWRQVKIGMTEDEAKKLLGEPLEETKIPDDFRDDPNYVKFLTFGRFRFASASLPGTFDFDITIKQGKVEEKHNPFGGGLSTDG